MILVCKHGKKVVVQIETYDPGCWDDGILRYDEDGNEIHSIEFPNRPSKEYLSVVGCRYCDLVEVDLS